MRFLTQRYPSRWKRVLISCFGVSVVTECIQPVEDGSRGFPWLERRVGKGVGGGGGGGTLLTGRGVCTSQAAMLRYIRI